MVSSVEYRRYRFLMRLLFLVLMLLPISVLAQVSCWNPSGSFITCSGAGYTFEATGKLGESPVNYWDNQGNAGTIIGTPQHPLIFPNPTVPVPSTPAPTWSSSPSRSFTPMPMPSDPNGFPDFPPLPIR